MPNLAPQTVPNKAWVADMRRFVLILKKSPSISWGMWADTRVLAACRLQVYSSRTTTRPARCIIWARGSPQSQDCLGIGKDIWGTDAFGFSYLSQYHRTRTYLVLPQSGHFRHCILTAFVLPWRYDDLTGSICSTAAMCQYPYHLFVA